MQKVARWKASLGEMGIRGTRRAPLQMVLSYPQEDSLMEWLALNVPTQPSAFNGVAELALWAFFILILVAAIKDR